MNWQIMIIYCETESGMGAKNSSERTHLLTLASFAADIALPTSAIARPSRSKTSASASESSAEAKARSALFLASAVTIGWGWGWGGATGRREAIILRRKATEWT